MVLVVGHRSPEVSPSTSGVSQGMGFYVGPGIQAMKANPTLYLHIGDHDGATMYPGQPAFGRL